MQINESLLKFLGFNTQGDLGPWTFYTAKDKGLVWFVKAPPLKPPSYLQSHQRNVFRNSARMWRAYTPAQRLLWMRAARLANLRIHGYHLFTYVNATRDTSILPAIERLSFITLPAVPT